MFTPRRSLTTIAALGLALLLGACDDSSVTAPESVFDDTPTGPAGATGIEQISERAAASALRLEIEVGLDGPPWVAEDVETEDDAERTEKVEARIRSIDPAGRRVELSFGGIVVDVAAGARLESEGSREITWEEFARRVERDLAAGEYPGAEFYRPLPAAPQAPSDATFTAVKVELEDDADDIELEFLVDDRHFQLGAAGTGTITLLGVDIAVDPSRGTEIRDRDDEWGETFDIEGIVSGVDVASGVVTLLDGRSFRVVAATRFEDDDDDYLGSLGEVSDALAAGDWVEVDADVRVAEDGTRVAVEVEFYTEDDVDDLPETLEFDEEVASVDLGASSFTLEDGRTFFVTAETRIDDDGDLRSLAEVAEALEAGAEVEADGYYVVDADAPGGTRLLEVEFDREDDDGDDDGDELEFDEEVASVDLGASSFTLEDGRTFFVTAETRIDDDGDLRSLAEVAEALEAGAEVEADGYYVVDADAPGGTRLLEVEFDRGDDDGDDDGDELESVDFEGEVIAVDIAASTFTLEGGVVYFVAADTSFDNDGDLFSLTAMAEALSEGLTLDAEGEVVADDAVPGGLRVLELEVEIED